MPTGSEASWAITLPNTFEPYGNIAQKGMEMKNQQNQMLYSQMLRQKAKDEEDQWKKLNLIQDLTDLSKHQTGNDVANAIGNGQMSKIYQKYTQNASKMSPIELQANIQKEMSGIITSMDGIKNELAQGDQMLAKLKQDYPNLEAGELAKIVRADVLNRHLKDDKDFNPAIDVKQTQLDLSNPQYLSQFVKGSNSLLSKITDPKRATEESVLMGKQGDYTKFAAKKYFYQKPANYDRSKFDPEGFYDGKQGVPTLDIKSTTLSSNSLPSSNGSPFKMVDTDVYKEIQGDGQSNLELIKLTKDAFPTYDSFRPEEKEYAERKVLYDYIKTNGQSQLIPETNVRPQVTHNKTTINTGGKNDDTGVRDLYTSIKNKASTAKEGLGYPLNQLSSAEQSQVLKIARDILSDNQISQADVAVRYNKDDTVDIIKADGTFVAPLDFTSTNVPAQVDVKARRKVVDMGKGTTPKPSTGGSWKDRAKKIN